MFTPRNIALLCAAVLVTACGSLNPFSAARTLEQRAYAAYGSFVVFEEQGAKLIQSPEVPASVKRSIQQADRVAKPAADQLKAAADSLLTAKRQLEYGVTTEDKVRIAAESLATWYADAAPKIRCLIAAVEEKPCSN